MNAPETGFVLDPRLEGDTAHVADLAFCRVLLMNDVRFPWLILVPRREGLAEFIDLAPEERARLAGEIDAASWALKDETTCDKLNVAALGNIVRQLHVHVVARFKKDAAWPGPVWGFGAATPYKAEEIADLSARIRSRLAI